MVSEQWLVTLLEHGMGLRDGWDKQINVMHEIVSTHEENEIFFRFVGSDETCSAEQTADESQGG